MDSGKGNLQEKSCKTCLETYQADFSERARALPGELSQQQQKVPLIDASDRCWQQWKKIHSSNWSLKMN